MDLPVWVKVLTSIAFLALGAFAIKDIWEDVQSRWEWLVIIPISIVYLFLVFLMLTLIWGCGG